jgi:two-component system chemotaxis sensor kinase CheA
MDDILRQIWPVFRAESRELIQTIASSVLSLEAGDPPPRLHETVQRHAHSLKGSAASVGVEDVVALAHAVEEALIAVQPLPRMPHATAEAILRTLDAMDSALEAAVQPGIVKMEGVEERVALLRASVPARSAPAATPASAVSGSASTPASAAAPPKSVPDAPPPAPPSPKRAPAEGDDRSIRVLASTIDQIGGYVESLALSHAAAEHRAHALLSVGLELQDAALVARASGTEDPQTVDTALGRIVDLAREVARHGAEAQREAMRQKLEAATVRDDLRDLRMIPISLALEPLRRTVRDAAERLEKPVELRFSGEDLRLDRRIVDAVKDPLVHLVRNAVDHGIESAPVRAAAGKPAKGRIEIRVLPRGHRVSVQVADDGAGLSVERIRDRAVQRGLLAAADAAQLSDQEVFRLAFTPGFSTADQVTSVSGRGVGLDVVQSAVSRLQGTIEVSSTPGRGATFELDLPLALSVTLAILVRLDDERAAIPAEAVERVLRLPPENVGLAADHRVARVGSAQVPFSPLRELLERSEGVPLDQGAPQAALLLKLGEKRMAVGVDEVLGERELVVRGLGRRGARAKLLAGAALLDDGAVVSVLNPAMLMGRLQPVRGSQSERLARVVVADDSLTSRAAVKAILEIAGYTVVPAGDGEEAWQHVIRGGVDLVVSDIQMPRLDGLALTRRIKGDPERGAIPVVLVTSMGAEEDRRAGLEAGADGYLVKKDVESGKLLDVVRMLLPGSRKG